MRKEDEDNTTFYTDHGAFCYQEMSFGLKNIGATYQRLADSLFTNHIGRNIEVYIDGMVIKSPSEGRLLGGVEETFMA